MSDLIDRQAAIDALGKAPKFKIGLLKKYAEGRNDQWFDDVAALVKLPSAQPERKKGKWIEENPQNSPDCRLIKCSECGDTYIVNMSIDYADWIEGRNFCRRCGADLRGGNNDKST